MYVCMHNWIDEWMMHKWMYRFMKYDWMKDGQLAYALKNCDFGLTLKESEETAEECSSMSALPDGFLPARHLRLSWDKWKCGQMDDIQIHGCIIA